MRFTAEDAKIAEKTFQSYVLRDLRDLRDLRGE
jgi:hypothetical protein